MRCAEGSPDSRVNWRVELARDAKKELARFPAEVQRRVARVLLPGRRAFFQPAARNARIATVGAFAWVIIEFSTSPTRLRGKLLSESSGTVAMYIGDREFDSRPGDEANWPEEQEAHSMTWRACNRSDSSF